MTKSLLVVVIAVITAGCFGPHRDWTDDLAWSPDGAHGALLVGGDLYLVDREGRLTPRLAADIYRVAWMNDSQRLVLARTRAVTTFAEIAVVLGTERTRAIVARAEQWWERVKRQAPEQGELFDLHDWDTAQATATYLREQHGEQLRQMLGDDWGLAEPEPVLIHALMLARVSDGTLEIVSQIDESLRPVKHIRPSDDGRAVALVVENEEFMGDHTPRLFVARLDRPAAPVLVGENTNEYPDWTTDGRSLVYMDASGEDVNIGKLGCLVKREVIDDRGELVPTTPGYFCQVDALFHKGSRVRTLRDGRVLFTALEASLPRWSAARSHAERVFLFDPSHPSAPVPLLPGEIGGTGVGFYDVSPDRTAIIYGTANGRIGQIASADGRFKELPLGLRRDDGYVRLDMPLAIWSGADAIVYGRRAPSGLQLIRRTPGGERILNRDWPRAPLRPPGCSSASSLALRYDLACIP